MQLYLVKYDLWSAKTYMLINSLLGFIIFMPKCVEHDFLLISDLVLMGYFECWRGGLNRTRNPIFPVICKLEMPSFSSFYQSFKSSVLDFLLVFTICSPFFIFSGVQGQARCCSACEKSWKGWIQSNCPHCWYPKARSQRSWHQEQVQLFKLSTTCNRSVSFSFASSNVETESFYKWFLTDSPCHHSWHWRTSKVWTLARWTKWAALMTKSLL